MGPGAESSFMFGFWSSGGQISPSTASTAYHKPSMTMLLVQRCHLVSYVILRSVSQCREFFTATTINCSVCSSYLRLNLFVHLHQLQTSIILTSIRIVSEHFGHLHPNNYDRQDENVHSGCGLSSHRFLRTKALYVSESDASSTSRHFNPTSTLTYLSEMKTKYTIAQPNHYSSFPFSLFLTIPHFPFH